MRHSRSLRLRLLAATVATAALSSIAIVGTTPASAASPTSTIGAAQVVTGGTDYSIALPVAGQGTRWYRLFVPSNLPSGSRPLIVALHYHGGSATSMESLTGFDAGAVVNGVLVAYPQGIDASFNAGTCCGQPRDTGVDDVAFVDAVLSDVEARYAVDTRKVAVGGWSNGGLMAYRYACERSDRVADYFAGSAVEVAPACAITKPINVLHMHGLVDTTVPWNGTTTEPLFSDGVVPNVFTNIGGVATLDGCQGWTTTITSALVTRYNATNCPSGASFTVLTSNDMGHRWPTGPADLAQYGMNDTGATWSFLLTLWNHLS